MYLFEVLLLIVDTESVNVGVNLLHTTHLLRMIIRADTAKINIYNWNESSQTPPAVEPSIATTRAGNYERGERIHYNS